MPSGTPSTTTAANAISAVERIRRRRMLRRSRLEAQADSANGHQPLGVARILTELAAQPRDMHVERLGRPEPVLVPDLRHDLLAGDDAPRFSHQECQQVELLRRELDLRLA